MSSVALTMRILTTLFAVADGTTLQHWLLIYAGGASRSAYQSDRLKGLLYADAGKQPQLLFSGIVCLDQRAPSGHSFLTWNEAGPPSPQDYKDYLDSLFANSGLLANLDKVVAGHHDTIGGCCD